MRIFKNAWFERFARKDRLNDQALREVIARAEKGLLDADLGSGVIKQLKRNSSIRKLKDCNSNENLKQNLRTSKKRLTALI